MSKNLTATVNGWTGTISVPNTIERDDYVAAMDALRSERLSLYLARDTGEIEQEEWQAKTLVVSGLAADLRAAYASDTLPEVAWSHS